MSKSFYFHNCFCCNPKVFWKYANPKFPEKLFPRTLSNILLQFNDIKEYITYHLTFYVATKCITLLVDSLKERKVNPLSANSTKWSNTLKQLKPANCLSVFDHFVKLVRKGLMTLD